MKPGCYRGTGCIPCENKGTVCMTKRVVYSAWCESCELNTNAPRPQNVYIGETSRQFGTRVSEHVQNLYNFKKDSFILNHWMEAHGMSTQPPKFQFKIIGIHQEALTRQLDEAINIRIIGNLNKRNEFATNELVRMESSKYSWEADKLSRDEKRSERLREEKLSCFVDVMKSVAKLPCINNQANASTNETHIYRFITGAKRLLDNQESIPDKRCRMDSSTPLKYRDPKKIDLESSPIMGACEDVIDLSGLTLSEDSSLNNMTVEGCTVQDQTQPNEDMVINKKCHKMNITQPKKDSPTKNVAKKSPQPTNISIQMNSSEEDQ